MIALALVGLWLALAAVVVLSALYGPAVHDGDPVQEAAAVLLREQS